MDPLIIAIIVAVFTLIVLFSGIPIAFGLSFVSIVLLVSFEGFQMLDVFAETFYAGLNSFVLLSIPMFILMGMAVANSPAGKDLYTDTTDDDYDNANSLQSFESDGFTLGTDNGPNNSSKRYGAVITVGPPS